MKIISKDEETFIIWFQGHDGFFSLDRNHPGFDRILHYTREIENKFSTCLVYCSLPKLEILDAVLFEEK